MPDDDEERGPERTCIVTRRKGAPETMIRFVVGPEDTVVPDIRRKLPGRGVWVDAEESQVAAALRKGAFARGFKAKVKAAPTLATDVAELLGRDALQSLAMANKAGLVVAGFAKVETAILGGKVTAVLHAAEAGEDGIRKMDAVLRRARERSDDGEGGAGRFRAPASIKLFSTEQLELALGRTNVIHAALAVGPAGHAFLTRCHRLIRYRSGAAHDRGADATVASA